MSFVPIRVLALVKKSMEMKLPMQVYLHEISILRAVYGGDVEVLHFVQADEILDGDNEMQRLTKVYGLNPQKQPWAEAIFGAYGNGAATLESLYSDEAERVREDLLGDASPFPAAPEPFVHDVTKSTIVPNVADIGTAQEQVPPEVQKAKVEAAKAKRASKRGKAETVS